MFKILSKTACVLACLMAPVAASAQQFQIQVNGAFTETPLAFTGGVADPYTFSWDIIEYQGQLALCGIGYLRDQRFSSTIRSMARDSGLEVDGRMRAVDLTFFTRARSMRDMRTGTATCQVVGPLPSTRASIGLQFATGTLRN